MHKSFRFPGVIAHWAEGGPGCPTLDPSVDAVHVEDVAALAFNRRTLVLDAVCDAVHAGIDEEKLADRARVLFALPGRNIDGAESRDRESRCVRFPHKRAPLDGTFPLALCTAPNGSFCLLRVHFLRHGEKYLEVIGLAICIVKWRGLSVFYFLTVELIGRVYNWYFSI